MADDADREHLQSQTDGALVRGSCSVPPATVSHGARHGGFFVSPGRFRRLNSRSVMSRAVGERLKAAVLESDPRYDCGFMISSRKV